MDNETSFQPVVKYDVSEAKVAELRGKYEGLTVKGVEDKGGLALAHVGRMEIKNLRVGIEKRRKMYNAGALDFTRMVNAKAKEATAPLIPLEAHLKAEEDRITAEKARIKAEAVRVEEERVQARVDALAEVGAHIPFATAKALTDEEFEARLQVETARHGIEQTRLAKEAEELRVKMEAEKKALAEAEESLAKFRLAQEAEKKRLEEVERKLNEDRMRQEREQALAQSQLETDRRALDEEKRIEAARVEAAEKAKREIEEQLAEAKRIREAMEKREAERAIRQEALRPDKEKIQRWAGALRDVERPEVADEEANALVEDALSDLNRIIQFIEEGAEEL